MIDWDFLISEALLAPLLPGEYSRFARPVSESLAVFLGGLPEERQLQVLAEQGELPAAAEPERRLAVLARSCPALHKLGQILARDGRLAPQLRSHLQGLESLPPSLPPSVPPETVQATLTAELGPLDRRGVTLTPPAIAEASVAVVVPFRNTGPGPAHGVFKVLKPGIEERLAQELDLFRRVGEHLDRRCDELGIPALDYREVFEQVEAKLRHEVRLDLEQQHLAAAADFYRGHAGVCVPALLDHCTPRVTAMERVFGGKVTDRRPGADPRRVATALVEGLIAQPIFSRARRAIFHADPHAGNLMLAADGRVAVLDWSLVGSLGEEERVAMTQVLLAAATLDPARVAAVLGTLGRDGRADGAALAAVAGRWVGKIRRGTLPGFTWLMGMLDDAVQTARLRVAADLILFRKSLYTLEGVVADAGGSRGQTDLVLLTEFVRRLAAEWPCRWLSPPDSRAFATRLSNVDLTGLALSLPWTAARVWLDRVTPLPG